MRKKLLAIIATAAMVVAMVPSMVFAANGLPEPVDGVIKLTEDVVLTGDVELADDVYIEVPKNEKVTLNLGGHKLSGKSTKETTSKMIKVAAGGDLTITDGEISFYASKPDTEWGGEGQPPYPGYASNTISNEGKLTVDNAIIGNITAPGGASYAIDNYSGSDLTINDGSVIDGHGKVAIRMFVGSATPATNVTINGGKVTGTRAIWVQLPSDAPSVAPDANVTVTGGELISTDDTYNMAIYVYSYGNDYSGVDVKISGGTLDDVVFTGGTANGGPGAENVEITGGVINDTYSYGTDDNAIDPYIKGGQFNKDVSEYVDSDSAMIGIKDVSGNTTYYVGDDVAEGIKNAPSGSTIEVMKAPEGTEIDNVPAGVTVVNKTDTAVKVNGTEVSKGEEVIIETTGTGSGEGSTTDKPENAIDTGDNMNMVVPIAIAIAALISMAAVVVTRRRFN